MWRRMIEWMVPPGGGHAAHYNRPFLRLIRFGEPHSLMNGSFNPLGSRKQGMIAAHRVEDQALIGLFERLPRCSSLSAARRSSISERAMRSMLGVRYPMTPWL
jgi:hypothetical protein